MVFGDPAHQLVKRGLTDSKGPGELRRFISISLATTGLSADEDRIVEIAAVFLDARGRPLDHWSSRVNPLREMAATEFHGLTEEDVADAPRFTDLAQLLHRITSGLVVVVHNSEFMNEFLTAEFARAQLPPPSSRTWCTLAGSKHYLPNLVRRRLADCCRALGLRNPNPRSTLDQAYATASLIEHFLQEDETCGTASPLAASHALWAPAPPSHGNPPRETTQRFTTNDTAGFQHPETGTGRPAPATGPSLVLTDEFRQALDHLHEGHHLFLTGKAGTGKSTLIRHFLENSNRNTVTVAPTGIAALNVDGYTIHRLFSFPIGVNEDYVRSRNYYPSRFIKAISSLDTLIIDEASMVRADLFDALCAALKRFGPRPREPFGGVQLVLVGDLFQLPPVVPDAESQWIADTYGTPFFFSARSFDPATFPVVELSIVFRQQGDDNLVNLLNAVREGELLEEARAELNSKTDSDFHPPSDEFWLTLATTNRIVTARNSQFLKLLPGPVHHFEAVVTGETDGFEFPTDISLALAAGAQIMLLNNDQGGRWVNGTLGKILTIDTGENGPRIRVELSDGRKEWVGKHQWDITRPVVEGGSLRHETIGSFTQFPIKLAWAITIHKSQGQTLDRVIVDLTGGTFANGQLYVALSRCTSLSGLVLKRDVLPRDLKTDIRVRRFLATGKTSTVPRGEAYLSILTVGTTGDRWKPRPVEIAVVTDDGEEATTVINPTSDLYRAGTEYGITTRDVQLAPLLREAWPALGSVLAGRIPVGPNIDQHLSNIDFELKRNGIVEPIPIGLDLPVGLLSPEEKTRLTAPSALERARTVRDAANRLRASGQSLPGTGTTFREIVGGQGYLLARTTGPQGTTSPTGFLVGGNLNTDDDPAGVLAGLLRSAWDRVTQRDREVVDRIRGAEEHFGVSIIPEDFEEVAALDIGSILTPGTRVCFSGTVTRPGRGELTKEELHEIAKSCGLVPQQNLTKTRTDVLIVAEAGSQSSKAKKAATWNKPIFTAEQFLDWAG